MKSLIILSLTLTSLSAFANSTSKKSELEIRMRKACRGELDSFGITKACASEEQDGRYWLFGYATSAGSPRAMFLKEIELNGASCEEKTQYSNWDREESKQILGADIFKTPGGHLRVVLDEKNGKIRGVDANNRVQTNNYERVSCSDSL